LNNLRRFLLVHSLESIQGLSIHLFEFLVVGFGGEKVEVVEGGALAGGGETVGFDCYPEEG
jgi:hypothetical protein